MMRPFFALAAVLLLAPVGAAQSELVRDAGVYVVLDALDPIRLGDDQLEAGGGVGWRFGNGLDVGVRVGAESTSFDGPDRELSSAERVAFALEVGYAAQLGRGVGLRLGIQGELQQTVEAGGATFVLNSDGEVTGIDRGDRDRNAGGARLSAAVFRRVPVRGVAVQPTVGAFWGGTVEASAPSERPFTLRADTGTSGGFLEAGLALEFPVLFRLSGLDLALVPHLRADVARERVDGRLSLRANF